MKQKVTIYITRTITLHAGTPHNKTIVSELLIRTKADESQTWGDLMKPYPGWRLVTYHYGWKKRDE